MRTLILSTGLTLAISQNAISEPVDKNFPGPYVGAGFMFGQASKADGDSSAGAAFGLGLDVGYIIKRDTWNRIELGVELGTANLSFESDNTDFDVEAMPQVLFKAGYGYSLGDHVFGIFRAGVGMASGELEASVNGRTLSTDATAMIGMIGWDVVYPANERLDFVAGLNLRTYAVNPDSATGIDSESFQLNVPAIYGQVRYRL
ncbi:outer membrane beta-barrel protein [Pseudobacteriovorax antillogorgiicola]|uniref:Outer membrane protein beta-barrel domain-containing protein n=1 Tax=Pseudobacteriovorax antillogorgiicola TaxID=1513793 RepID=A0A1Y6CHF9_9BACT|nr:outer membrane beta-barrel protein [Pseudobacteriovorax antillogorgiicola]TCS48638.1 outer membrane protein with beta-barrel domain [Pseudobacteriovorax antillogorgiicola]SMF55301.1 Outer membrane protein beta-barrel domain-containing protein [Pseudobacteriovorax antillogorgiicola]